MKALPFERLSRSPEETRRAGRELAELLAPGDLVLLSGPLGAGKTELVRGLAAGLGADPAEVASPTFSLVHEYGPSGSPPLLLHADLYRLPEESRAAAAAGDLGLVEARERGSVVVVEWPEGLGAESGDWQVALCPGNEEARRIVVRRAP